MNSKLVILVAILYIASAASGNLVVRYQQELVVDCSGLSGDVALFKSHADGTSSKVEAGEDVSVADKVFTIKQIKKKADVEAAYVCSNGNENKTLDKVVAPYIYKPEKLSLTITEKGSVEFECVAFLGDEKNTWKWLRGNETVGETNPRFKVVTETNSSKLRITEVDDADKGNYTCVLTNDHGSHSEVFKLRVKDALAALWPFLGIVAEVVVLCVIILVYEKKCNKKPSQSEEENEAAHSLMGKEGSSDVKKRAVKA